LQTGVNPVPWRIAGLCEVERKFEQSFGAAPPVAPAPASPPAAPPCAQLFRAAQSAAAACQGAPEPGGARRWLVLDGGHRMGERSAQGCPGGKAAREASPTAGLTAV
jgi:hypothetical protein